MNSSSGGSRQRERSIRRRGTSDARNPTAATLSSSKVANFVFSSISTYIFGLQKKKKKKDLKLYDQAKCNNCRLAMQFSKKQRSKIERLMHNTDISTEDLREKVYLVLNTKPCPRCAIPIERDGGCDHMTCNRCQSSFW